MKRQPTEWEVLVSKYHVSMKVFMYSCHLFLISSVFVKSLPFLSFIEPIFAWNVPLVSLIFLKRSLVFLILLFSSISLHWLPRKALSLLAILWTLHSNGNIFPFLLCFSLPFFSLLFVRLPQTAILLFFISFSWGWSWFLSSVQCHEPPSIVHQALYQIKALKSISHFHCMIIRDLV